MDLQLRFAVPADAGALRDLSALDSSPRVPAGDVVLALVDGVPVAAVAVADGHTVADPFRPTADLVALLRVRAAQARAAAQPSPRTIRSAASAARSIRALTWSRG